MNRRYAWVQLSAAIAVASFGLAKALPCPAAEPSPPALPAAGEDVETLLRGPLHEAFAEPIPLNPQPATVVPKQPPEPIEELPPEAKPADQNVIWIPGYWAWDEEREDFLYVSGVWRVPPQDRRWVPGYWTQTQGGYQWVSGFWSATGVAEVQYLPAPPESLESGPSSPSPSTEHYWVSGNWCYQDDRYAWRPGYWDVYREGWVWVPAHYVWTPQGVVFVDGYWDYPFPRRGVVFAPVWFPQPAYLRHGFCYTPSVVVDISHLLVHMFVHPRRCHYYWGDYYADRWQRGHHFYPCYDYHGRHGYDPVFAYYDAYHRHRQIDYTQRLRGWHDYFRGHEEFRPPHTLHAQAQLAARAEHHADLQYALLGRRLDDVMSERGGPAHFERISPTHRQSWIDAASHTRELTRRRLDVETHHQPLDLATRDRPPGRIEGPVKFVGKPDASRPPVKLRLPDLPQIAGFRPTHDAPERPGKPRPSERADVPRNESPRISPPLPPALGTLRDGLKPPKSDPTRAPPRSLPDVSKLRQPDASRLPSVTPKIETPRIPGFSPPNLGSARPLPPARNLTESEPRVTLPRTAPTPDRTLGFKLPERGPSSDTAPSLERTFTFKPPERGPGPSTVRPPERTFTFKLPERGPSPSTVRPPERTFTFKPPERGPSPRIPSPRIESPRPATPEVRRPQLPIPKLPSPAPSPSRTPRANIESPNPAARPRFEIPNQPSGVDRPRSETPNREVRRPEFKAPDVSRTRSEPPRVDSNRPGPPGGGPGSGRHKR